MESSVVLRALSLGGARQLAVAHASVGETEMGTLEPRRSRLAFVLLQLPSTTVFLHFLATPSQLPVNGLFSFNPLSFAYLRHSASVMCCNPVTD